MMDLLSQALENIIGARKNGQWVGCGGYSYVASIHLPLKSSIRNVTLASYPRDEVAVRKIEDWKPTLTSSSLFITFLILANGRL